MSVYTAMSNSQAVVRSPATVRVWPGLVIVLLQWAVRFGLPAVNPDFTMYGVLAGVVGWFAIIVWWLFFSRAERADRWGGVVVMILALAGTYPFLDISMATGAQGFIFPMLALPGLSLAFVLWAMASHRWSPGLTANAYVCGCQESTPTLYLSGDCAVRC